MELYEIIDKALIIDKTDGLSDVDDNIRSIINNEFPDIFEFSENLDFVIELTHHYEDIHYIGPQVNFFIPDELQNLFKEKYPEEFI